jgi:hypothetical protein
MQVKDKDKAQQELVNVLKEGPYRYFKVCVSRPVVRETEYFVRLKGDQEFDEDEYIPELSMNGIPDGWIEVHDDPLADEQDPEITSVQPTDKDGNELKYGQV